MRRMCLTAGVVTFAALGGLAAGCGGDDGDSAATDSGAREGGSTTSARRADAESKRRPRGASAKVMESPFGTILADGDDRALYLFTRDRRGPSRCYGECAEAWPPLFTEGKPRALKDVKQSLLGTTERRDGRLQVTYRGQPLYYYKDDPVGEVLCQAVDEFGGLWYVVSPGGRAIR